MGTAATSQTPSTRTSGVSRGGRDVRHISETRDADVDFLIEPKDEDRFVKSARQIIAACDLQGNVDLWRRNFVEMGDRVRAWCGERAGRVSASFAELRSDKVIVYFTPVGERYDFDLGGELATLSRELSGFGLGRVQTHQVPGGELGRFVNLPRAFVIYQPFQSPDEDTPPREPGTEAAS